MKMMKSLIESDLIPYQAAHSLPSGAVLALAPHPDDEVFGCGGAIMRHVQQGDPARVVFLTDGRAARAHASEAEMRGYVALREQEARNAAHILGYKQIEFWGIPDRELQCNEQLAQRLAGLIRQHGFQRLYAPSPAEVHPDHYQAALLALQAVREFDLTVCFYEIGAPATPNLLLDITDLLDRKRLAMSCYASQMQLQEYTRHVEALNVYRTYTLPPQVRAAEAYFCISSAELRAAPALRYGRSRQTLEQLGLGL